MTQTKGQNWQDVQQSALDVIGTPSRTTNEVILSKVDQHFDAPVRAHAAPVPDSKLYFTASVTEAGDGSAKTLPPIDDRLVGSPAGSLDYQNIATPVDGITLTREGNTYTHPVASAAGEFIVGAFVRKSDGSFDCRYSDIQASLNDARAIDVGILFSGLDGLPVNYIYLESTDNAGRWKSPGAATDVIQNKVGSELLIYRFGAGGGAGGGADRTYRVSTLSGGVATIKGGYAYIDDGRVLASGSGTTSTAVGTDITADLSTVLAQSVNVSLAGDDLLALCIDLNTLSPDPTTLTDNKREVYLWGSTNLVFLSKHPDEVDPRRYVLISQIFVPDIGGISSSTAVAKPTRLHQTLAGLYPNAETWSQQITSGAGIQTFAHNLSGEPQLVVAYYYDGTNKNAVDPASVIVHKSSTQVKASADAYDVTGGKYVEVQAVYFPGTKTLASHSRTFTSGWYDSTATTTVPHGLNDTDDIRGYEVQEWDTSTGRIRNIDRSALVVDFDATNFYLDWTGLSPSSSLKYRIVAGGSPLPWAVPTELGGYTKFVGAGPGSYASLTAALAAAAAGDRILVMRSTTETVEISIPAGVTVEQMPGTVVTFQNPTTGFGVVVHFAGDKAKWLGMDTKLTGIISIISRFLSVEAADCKIDGHVEIDCSGQTVTDMAHIDTTGLRANVMVGVKRTAGTVTNLLTNNDGAGWAQVWGG